jgi:hypothetical protein
MTTDNFCFYLQNRLIQTIQTGGQQYSDTFPFSISCENIVSYNNSLKKTMKRLFPVQQNCFVEKEGVKHKFSAVFKGSRLEEKAQNGFQSRSSIKDHFSDGIDQFNWNVRVTGKFQLQHQGEGKREFDILVQQAPNPGSAGQGW